MTLIIEATVGYMLKVLKNGFDTTPFKNEFNAIRHGDYAAFIKNVGEETPFMVIYSKGQIRTEENNPNYEFDFEGLLKSGPSLKKFLFACQNHYGKIKDDDLNDSIFQRCAVFEIAIRMHANNANLLSKTERTELEKVIDLLSAHKGIEKNESDLLHEGRKFINKIKHHKNGAYNWRDEVEKFEKAFQVLKKWKILVY
jgi:hypothetical protein